MKMDQRYIRENAEPKRRIFGLSLAAATMFFLLLTRLWYLQIIESDNLLDQSENNRLRFVPVAAPRGAILDRNGKVLVSNTPSFSVALIPQDVKDKDVLLDNLSRYLGLNRMNWCRNGTKAEGERNIIRLLSLRALVVTSWSSWKRTACGCLPGSTFK